MASFFGNKAVGGVPCTPSLPVVRGFISGESPYFEKPYAIAGVTRDSTGAALGVCNVTLFRTNDDSIAGRTISDASGNYLIVASPALTHYVVSYKAGSPDVAGTTLNTLVGA